MYFSNRSAAHANSSSFDAALADAQAVLKLKPGWVKGHARAAVAYMGLQLYSEAKEAYEKAVKLEPDDQVRVLGWCSGCDAAACSIAATWCSQATNARCCCHRVPQALQRALDRAIGLELQHMREHKHVFKKARAGGGVGSSRGGGGNKQQHGGSGSGSSKPDKGEQGSKARRKGGMLSFAEDEEDG